MQREACGKYIGRRRTNILKSMEDKKNCTGPLTIALQYNDLFDLDSNSASTNTGDALPKGRAVAFIKAVQIVNEKLVEQNKTESLLFEVILIAKECSEEIKMKIIESVTYYGLEIGKFFFCKKEELKNTLQSNKIKLFLSTDRDDVCEALNTGIPAALLYDQSDDHVLNQLKVIFSGDVIGFSEDSLDSLSDFGFSESQIETFKAAKICMKEFAVLIGQMRKKFRQEDSPLCICVLTAWGSTNVCASALKTLRDWGLDVDEAFCLAGAPCSPILAVVKPHILWDGGLHNMRDLSTHS